MSLEMSESPVETHAMTPVGATPPPADTLIADDAPARRRSREPRAALFGGRLGLGVMAAGLLVIGFGWYGISGDGALIDGSTDVRAQLPYLLSGGFLGLSLVVVGAALFLAQTTRVEQARAAALVEARFEALQVSLGLQVGVPAGMVVSGGAAYHSPDCRLVDGREGQELVTVEVAEASGLRPCRLCLR